MSHKSLGDHLLARGQLKEAIDEFRAAIELEKERVAKWRSSRQRLTMSLELNSRIHNSLGWALARTGNPEEAIDQFREAIELDQRNALPHYNLGQSLENKGQREQAINEYRTAIRLTPNYAAAHISLGVALWNSGQLDEGIDEVRQAIRLRNDVPVCHYTLGFTLRARGRLEEAADAFRGAIRLNTNYAEAHCDLGGILMEQGEFHEALRELRRGDEIGSRDPKWRYPSAEWVRQCKQMIELEGRLPDFLDRTIRPASPAECVELARLCWRKRLYRATGRFYEEAFATEAALAEDPRTFHRYNAARAKALSGCGEGKDAGNLDEAERTRLRGQALDWLRADLNAWGRLLDRDQARAAGLVDGKLQERLARRDFACVLRPGPEAQARLPLAERLSWQDLWMDVICTRARAQGMIPLQKKPDEPATKPTPAKKLRPTDDVATLIKLGTDARLKGQIVQALEYFTWATEADPKNARAWELRGELSSGPEAVESYSRVVALNPRDTVARLNRAHLFWGLGRYDRALIDFAKVLELEPTHNGALFTRGQMYRKLGLPDKAFADYSQAIALAPNHYYALCGRAELYEEKGHWKEASADYLKALERLPGDSKIRNALGVAHYRAGDWKAAIEAFTKSLEDRYGNHGTSYFFLAMAQLKLGNRDEALKSYAQAVQWMRTYPYRSGDEQLRRHHEEAAQLLGVKP
jgi:tetratricopeptide (TPR) repeat protein